MLENTREIDTEAVRGHEKKTKEDLITLNLYKPEFDPVIRVYAQVRAQYDQLTEIYEKSNYSFETRSGVGVKKAPIVTTLESLRKDILSYASQLGLTPQGLLKADGSAFAKKKGTTLAEALKKAGK